MKKKALLATIAATSLTLFTLSTNSAYAWSYSDYSKGSYVPKSGSGSQAMIYDGTNHYLQSTVNFKFDSTNVTNIKDYNNGGDNPGTACDNASAYVTLDQTAKADSGNLEISATQVTTNLPNPKTDVEDNNFIGSNDESEVTVLGTVASSTAYWMATKWKDQRDGDSGDSGKIQAQFAMSKKGLSDYNNCTQSTAVQHTFTYGDNRGTFASIQPLKLNLASTNTSVEADLKAIAEYKAIENYKAIETTETGISTYKNKQEEQLKALKSKKINDIAVTVTFSEPLSFGDVQALVHQHKIDVDLLQARTIDNNGDRITHTIAGVEKAFEQDTDNFVGYINLQGYISSDAISSLELNEKVYLADVSGDNSVTNLEEDYFAIPLTWNLEDLNQQ
ncbi:TPA: hypothetical protein ACN7HJ_005302 [Klebsiella pneumoniae]|uniref:hypothetical protein n=1 Tax=Caryophanaceae TaxID=186818 RepID=UPI000D300E18|nr:MULTISPECIES: hypothetical protein [Planococcaceae]